MYRDIYQILYVNDFQAIVNASYEGLLYHTLHRFVKYISIFVYDVGLVKTLIYQRYQINKVIEIPIFRIVVNKCNMKLRCNLICCFSELLSTLVNYFLL